MGGRLVGVSGFLTLLIFLSGCTGGNSAAVVRLTAEPAVADTDTGGIEGVILDDEDLPLQGVEVGIPTAGIVTQTDSAGRFSLSHVPPGAVDLHAALLGYHYATRAVDVVAGEVVRDLEIKLLPIVTERPFEKTQIKKGLFGCGASWRPAVALSGLAACGLLSLVPADTSQQDQFLIVWQLPDPTRAWNMSVFEMQWDSTQVAGKGLWMIWEVNGCVNANSGSFGQASGRSPIKLVSDAAKIATVTKAACQSACPPTSCEVVSRVFATPETFGSSSAADLGLSAQQPFIQYLTAFYHAPGPADYTALK